MFRKTVGSLDDVDDKDCYINYANLIFLLGKSSIKLQNCMLLLEVPFCRSRFYLTIELG